MPFYLRIDCRTAVLTTAHLHKISNRLFSDYLPDQVKSKLKKTHLDWEKIDNELARKIEIVCEEIFKTTEKLVRVSITEIIRRVGHKNWIEKRHLKLLITAELIERKLESLEDFMLRKIELAKHKFIREGRMPTKLQFMIEASIRNTTSKNSIKVQNSIDETLAEIL